MATVGADRLGGLLEGAMRAAVAVVAVVLSTVSAACSGGDPTTAPVDAGNSVIASHPDADKASTPAPVSITPPAEDDTAATPTGTAAASTGVELTVTDVRQISAALTSWVLTGDCDVMADEFLAEQTLGLGGKTRAAQCAYFASIFTAPAFTEDAVEVRHVEGTRARATAVVTDDYSGIEVTYTLIARGSGWRILTWDS